MTELLPLAGKRRHTVTFQPPHPTVAIAPFSNEFTSTRPDDHHPQERVARVEHMRHQGRAETAEPDFRVAIAMVKNRLPGMREQVPAKGVPGQVCRDSPLESQSTLLVAPSHVPSTCMTAASACSSPAAL